MTRERAAGTAMMMMCVVAVLTGGCGYSTASVVQDRPSTSASPAGVASTAASREQTNASPTPASVVARDAWHRYEAPDGSISFEVQGVVQTRERGTGKARAHVFSASGNPYNYEVSWTDNDYTDTAWMNLQLEAMAANDFKVVHSSDVTVTGFPGHHLAIESPATKGRVQVWVQDGRSFVMMIASASSPVSDADADRFFKSVKATGGPGNQWHVYDAPDGSVSFEAPGAVEAQEHEWRNTRMHVYSTEGQPAYQVRWTDGKESDTEWLRLIVEGASPGHAVKTVDVTVNGAPGHRIDFEFPSGKAVAQVWVQNGRQYAMMVTMTPYSKGQDAHADKFFKSIRTKRGGG